MRKITSVNLFFLSLGSIIGSGWLYGVYFTAKTAGNSAVISWILGGFMLAIIALCYAEVSLNKQFNNLTQVAKGSFGKNGNILVSLLTWIWTTLIPPIEVQATVQYASNYLPWIKDQSSKEFSYSYLGFLLSFFLLFIMFLVNIFSSNTVGRVNKIITFVKVIIPVAVSCIFIYVLFQNPSNVLNNLSTGFFSEGIENTFSAISTCGIAFSFIGFQTVIFLANETENPQKSIPRAIFGSIFIALIIYVMVQLSFNLSVPNTYLNDGWSQLSFAGDSGPIAGLLGIFGFVSFSYFLYIDAVISPFGTGLGYKTAASRVLAEISDNKILPKFISIRNRFGSPYLSNSINFFIGLFFIYFFPSWSYMIVILCGLIILTMSYVPLYVIYLRISNFNNTSFKMKRYLLTSFLSFFFCNLMFVWCGWEAIRIVMIIFFVILSFTIIKDIKFKTIKFNPIYHLFLPSHICLLGYVTYFKFINKNISFSLEVSSLFVFSLMSFLLYRKMILSHSQKKIFTKKDAQADFT
ncbi:APC family permease [Spirobacillus cienkowskii]|uniref:APC family permease n=1 Tax=Spirobacillus cienkowskii TaxID=495820 RepID=UPI0030CCBF46